MMATTRGFAPTRVCLLTPEGRGAVAVLRLWGPGALAVADSVFRPSRGVRLAETPPGRPRLGRIGEGLGDEVVGLVCEGDPPEVEIQCHGGPAAIALVVEALSAAGAPSGGSRSPGVRHASRSAVAAEAEVDLTRASTLRAAEVFLEQAQGALECEARRLIALMEADPGRALEGLEVLIRRSEVGLRLVAGWRVVLAGRPNVGKSRLLNALAGYDRAIVDPSPGTTRDVVSFRTALDGWPVELADTAGLRESLDVIESSGVALARAHQREADLVLLVLDRSEALSESDRALIRSFESSLLVANKADLPAAWDASDPSVAVVSAQRGDGIEGLVRAIACRLVPDPPLPGAGIPFRAGQVRRLRAARASLHAADPAIGGARLLEGMFALLPR